MPPRAAGGAPPIFTGTPELQRRGLIEFKGQGGGVPAEGAEPTPVLDGHVPLGGTTLTLPPGANRNFPIGSAVLVRRFGNTDWWEALELAGRAFPEPHSVHAHERTVVAHGEDTITVDVGLAIALEGRWGGGEVIACDAAGRISHVGCENLRGASEFDPSVVTNTFTNLDRPLRESENQAPYVGFDYYSDENHWFNFITMENVVDSWVRGVHGQHFVSSIVRLGGGCKHTTVADSSSAMPTAKAAARTSISSSSSSHRFRSSFSTSGNDGSIDCFTW